MFCVINSIYYMTVLPNGCEYEIYRISVAILLLPLHYNMLFFLHVHEQQPKYEKKKNKEA